MPVLEITGIGKIAVWAFEKVYTALKLSGVNTGSPLQQSIYIQIFFGKFAASNNVCSLQKNSGIFYSASN